jgi:N-acetylglucosaminyldiphosphoundecaprenol N-acetyl-beta-D-mannosaminyltransferase
LKRTTIFNFPITLGKYQDFINNIIESAKAGSGKYIYVANVHMLIEACRNKSFLDQAHRAFIITPDGKPITWALRLLNGIKQDRVAGMDLLPALFAKAEEAQLPVYIYGGTIALLDQTIKYLKNN